MLLNPPRTPFSRPGRAWPGLARVAGLLAGLAVFCSTVAPAQAPPAEAPQYNVKAGFLAAFTQYIRWPDSTFAAPDSPIIIGVLGTDPFGKVLVKTAGQQTGARVLLVRHLANPAEAAGCQMVFISRAEGEHEAEWLAALKGKPIVTVGESGHTIERGGMLEFTNDGTHVRFNASLPAIQQAGVKVGSPILGSAQTVIKALEEKD